MFLNNAIAHGQAQLADRSGNALYVGLNQRELLSQVS